MAVYGPVRHPKKYYMDLRSFGSIYYFFGDGPVHILPYNPQCHELFAIYFMQRKV
jgi:hypothetical protein